MLKASKAPETRTAPITDTQVQRNEASPVSLLDVTTPDTVDVAVPLSALPFPADVVEEDFVP